jgi:hypothetical protein
MHWRRVERPDQATADAFARHARNIEYVSRDSQVSSRRAAHNRFRNFPAGYSYRDAAIANKRLTGLVDSNTQGM